MKHRLCSYDMAEVAAEGFVLSAEGGEMYFCNVRCLAVWPVHLATRSSLPDEQRLRWYTLNTQSEHEQRFDGITRWARWAVDQALRSTGLEGGQDA